MTTKKQNVDFDRKKARAFLEKIVVNTGVGRASQMANFQDKIMPQITRDIAAMTGQMPQVRATTKSIAGFKTRAGQISGLRVTLRRDKMVDFFERFIRIVLPRVRDFGGISLSNVDHSGSLNVGLKEQFVFAEINQEQSPYTFPFGVTIVPKVKHREAAIEIYRALGVPFKKQ
jgi:large subunit ribosomal protein L5